MKIQLYYDTILTTCRQAGTPVLRAAQLIQLLTQLGGRVWTAQLVALCVC